MIADLERGVAVDVDRIRAVLRDLGKLRQHGDMTAGDALAGGFEILKTVIELLTQLLQLALARGGLAMRLSQVRYINIETPMAPVRPGQTAAAAARRELHVDPDRPARRRARMLQR